MEFLQEVAETMVDCSVGSQAGEPMSETRPTLELRSFAAYAQDTGTLFSKCFSPDIPDFRGNSIFCTTQVA